MSAVNQSTKFFNTAIVATKIQKLGNYSSQLNELVQSKPFEYILKAIREYAASMNASEEQAAEDIIQTFRKIDQTWDNYIFQEGLGQLKTHLSN